jgi:transposase
METVSQPDQVVILSLDELTYHKLPEPMQAMQANRLTPPFLPLTLPWLNPIRYVGFIVGIICQGAIASSS